MSQFRVLAFGSDSTTGNAHTQMHPYTPHCCFISIVAVFFLGTYLVQGIDDTIETMCHLIFSTVTGQCYLIFQVKIGLRGGKLLC